MKALCTFAGVVLLTPACTHRVAVVAPTAPTVWERQVKNARDVGDGDYVLRTLRERIAAEPDNIAVRMELAQAYRDRGFADVALEICRLAVARFPESGEAELGLVQALRDLNRRQDAIAGLAAFLAAHPQQSPDYQAWLGILRDESAAWQDAEASHRRALALAPTSDYLHNNLGYNLLNQKRNQDAAAEFREALRLNPTSQMARNNLGLALANQDATGEALQNWQSAGDPATAHNNLAVILIEKGNYPEARKELEIALGYNKSHPAALRNLELVSHTDGGPSAGESGEQSRWTRWKGGIKRLFVGPLESGTGERK